MSDEQYRQRIQSLEEHTDKLVERGDKLTARLAERDAEIASLKAKVQQLQDDMMALHESADREIHGLYNELMSAKNLLAFIDEISPASAAQVFEPGLTFTEACRRQMIVVWENAEAERQDE